MQEFAELLLSGCFKDPSRSGQIQYLLAGFADGITVTRQAQHVADDDESLNREYEKFVQEALATSIITPLCNEIDRTLRLRIHSVKLTSMEPPNPKTSSYRARAPLLALTVREWWFYSYLRDTLCFVLAGSPCLRQTN